MQSVVLSPCGVVGMCYRSPVAYISLTDVRQSYCSQGCPGYFSLMAWFLATPPSSWSTYMYVHCALVMSLTNACLPLFRCLHLERWWIFLQVEGYGIIQSWWQSILSEAWPSWNSESLHWLSGVPHLVTEGQENAATCTLYMQMLICSSYKWGWRVQLKSY